MGGEPTRREVALYALGFVVLCALTLAFGNAPVPILHDMAEAYAWGQQFELGYNQHPPFWAWVGGVWFRLVPPSNASFAALDALNAGVGLLGAWALIGDFAQGPKRVAALALLLLTPIYTLGAWRYDANTIFLSLWPWTTHAFLQAVRTRRLGWALAFGALAGLCLLAKYYAVLLIGLCGLAALATVSGRLYLRSASPWISAAVAALLFAPHAVWLLGAGAPPVRYFASVSGLDAGTAGRAAFGMTSSVALSFLGVVAILSYFARRDREAAPARESEAARRLLILGLGPLLATLAAGLVLRVRLTPEMPIGGLALIPLLLIEALGIDATRGLAAFARKAAAVVMLGMAALSPMVMVGRTFIGDKASGVPPYPELAAALTKVWRERTGERLAYVGGFEPAHYVAFYSPDRPQTFFGFDFGRNLWVTPERLAKRGWVAVCAAEDAACLAAAPKGERLDLTLSHQFLGHVGRPRGFVAFLVPPSGG